MPRHGAWVVSDFPAGLEHACTCRSCGYQVAHTTAELLEMFGDDYMPNVLGRLARRAGCSRVENKFRDTCQLIYATTAPDKLGLGPTTERDRAALSNLQPWMMLLGECGKCHWMGQVNRRRIERHFGKDADVRHLQTRLVCTACRNREGNILKCVKMPR